jgi:hypothetical protein
VARDCFARQLIRDPQTRAQRVARPVRKTIMMPRMRMWGRFGTKAWWPVLVIAVGACGDSPPGGAAAAMDASGAPASDSAAAGDALAPSDGRGGAIERAMRTLVIDKDAHDFGALDCGEATQVFRVRNTGVAPSGVLDVKVNDRTGATKKPFRLAMDECGGRRLGPGETCALSVSFTSTGGGATAYRAELNVWGNPGGGLYVPLTGAESWRHSLVLEPAVHDFGPVAVGSVSQPVGLVLRDERKLELVPELASVLGGPWFQVVDDGCSRRTIAPGQSCSVQVRFAPIRSGEQKGGVAVRARSGACVLGQTQMALVGTGVVPPDGGGP